jgi:sugar O-acyltransferase (sialic acid O-acetyltransferase NeuD family)
MANTNFAFPRGGFGPNSLIIYGGGGHCKTIIDLVRALGTYQLIGIIDDRLQAGSLILDVPILGGSQMLPRLFDQGLRKVVNAVGAIGHVDVRIRIFDLLKEAGFQFPTVIHPTAFVEPSAKIEDGVQILAKSYVSSAATIGFGTVINAGVVVSHDCTIGKYVNLSPGTMLAGGVVLKDRVQVGMAATINIDVTVGEGSRIGNGTAVKADVPPDIKVRAGTIWPIKEE